MAGESKKIIFEESKVGRAGNFCGFHRTVNIGIVRKLGSAEVNATRGIDSTTRYEVVFRTQLTDRASFGMERNKVHTCQR
jgi:hypothetical protein